MENKVIEVSHDAKNWYKRVLICIKNNTAICWQTADTLEKSEIEVNTCTWRYWREFTEAKFRPFTWEDKDLVKGKWIKPKSRVKCERLIAQVFKSTEGWFYIWIENTAIRADDLLKDYEFADGSPCGILEAIN